MNIPESEIPAQPGWRAVIESLQNRGREAFLAQDIGRLKTLWAEGFMVNSPMGRVLHREQALDLLAKGVISHASYEEHIEAVERTGDVVVVMGRDVITDIPGGPEILRRFTNVWTPDGDSWQMIARHAHPFCAP